MNVDVYYETDIWHTNSKKPYCMLPDYRIILPLKNEEPAKKNVRRFLSMSILLILISYGHRYTIMIEVTSNCIVIDISSTVIPYNVLYNTTHTVLYVYTYILVLYYK